MLGLAIDVLSRQLHVIGYTKLVLVSLELLLEAPWRILLPLWAARAADTRPIDKAWTILNLIFVLSDPLNGGVNHLSVSGGRLLIHRIIQVFLPHYFGG